VPLQPRPDPYLTAHLTAVEYFTQEQGDRISRRRKFNRYFHALVNSMVVSQVPPNQRVLDVGCGEGDTLNALQPTIGLGVDIDPLAVAVGLEKYPHLEFRQTALENFSTDFDPNYVVASFIFDQLYDIDSVLQTLRNLLDTDGKLVVTSYNRIWMPLIRLAEILRIKSRGPAENYVPGREIENLLELCNFEVVKTMDGVLIPIRIPIVSNWVNRWIAPLPLIRQLSLVRVTVARPTSTDFSQVNSVSVIIAARNEEGNIRDLLARIPQMAPKQEIIFVEGNSTDDTWGEITRVMNEARNPDQKVIALQQEGKGKGDAVRAGFAVASGEILMILDADISVPPEELPKFVRAIAEEKCQFANGSRLVYPMDDDAMRFLNLLGTRFFGMLFTYLLSQPIRDTLCGTKVLRRTDYETIAANRSYFGEFDPFGDFDLLFGAARLSLKIRDIPVHYKERTYGETNISRFSHGLLLFRMSWIAAKRLKFVKVNLASKK
jgi:SAM-dependent methyltransferase